MASIIFQVFCLTVLGLFVSYASLPCALFFDSLHSMESEAAALGFYSWFTKTAWQFFKEQRTPTCILVLVVALVRISPITPEFQCLLLLVAALIAVVANNGSWHSKIEEMPPLIDAEETKEQPKNSNGKNRSKNSSRKENKPKVVMAEKLATLEEAKEAYLRNTGPDHKVVSGASVVTYEIDCTKDTCSINFELEDKRTTAAKCIQGLEPEKVKDYYFCTSKVKHDGILSPHLVSKNEEKDVWILLYEKYNCYLNNWDWKKELKSKTDKQKWWFKSIKKILKAIVHTHSQKLIHGGLDKESNYVIHHDGQLKLINIESENAESSENAKDSENETTEKAKRSEANMRRDFIQFRNFLAKILPREWRDLQLFLDFFDKEVEFSLYVDKLIIHPFLMSAQKRLMYFFQIHQAIKNNMINSSLFESLLQEDPSFMDYRDWNSRDKRRRMDEALAKTYQYGRDHGIYYNGQELISLIEFLRNVYVHNASCGSYELIDAKVTNLYEGLLSNVHELLSRKNHMI